MIAVAFTVGVLLSWYANHRCYVTDRRNAHAVTEARIDGIKAAALEATELAQAAVDQATETTLNALLDVEWARVVIAEQQGELDRIRARHVLLPTLDGIRAERAESAGGAL